MHARTNDTHELMKWKYNLLLYRFSVVLRFYPTEMYAYRWRSIMFHGFKFWRREINQLRISLSDERAELSTNKICENGEGTFLPTSRVNVLDLIAINRIGFEYRRKRIVCRTYRGHAYDTGKKIFNGNTFVSGKALYKLRDRKARIGKSIT